MGGPRRRQTRCPVEPELESRRLIGLSFCRRLSAEFEASAADSRRALGSIRPEALWDRADALLNLLYCEYMLGRFDACDALLPDIDAAARKSGHSGAAWLATRVRSNMRFLRTGDIREFLAQAEQSLEAPQFRYIVRTYVGLSRFYLGDVDQGLEQLEMVITEQPSGHYLQGLPEGNLFAALALAGETRRAEALIARVTDLLPIPKRRNLQGRFLAIDGLVTGLTVLGDRARCGQLYPLTEDYILTGAVSAIMAVGPSNPQLAAGLAAAAAGLTARARDHFETALRQARERARSDTPANGSVLVRPGDRPGDLSRLNWRAVTRWSRLR